MTSWVILILIAYAVNIYIFFFHAECNVYQTDFLTGVKTNKSNSHTTDSTQMNHTSHLFKLELQGKLLLELKMVSLPSQTVENDKHIKTNSVRTTRRSKLNKYIFYSHLINPQCLASNHVFLSLPGVNYIIWSWMLVINVTLLIFNRQAVQTTICQAILTIKMGVLCAWTSPLTASPCERQQLVPQSCKGPRKHLKRQTHSHITPTQTHKEKKTVAERMLGGRDWRSKFDEETKINFVMLKEIMVKDAGKIKCTERNPEILTD